LSLFFALEKMDPVDAWDRGAAEAANAGLKNANVISALMNLFYSPTLPGGSMQGNMGIDIGNGIYRSIRSPDRLIEALEDGTLAFVSSDI
jgi:hypothetical protein